MNLDHGLCCIGESPLDTEHRIFLVLSCCRLSGVSTPQPVYQTADWPLWAIAADSESRSLCGVARRPGASAHGAIPGAVCGAGGD
jgi:hypothetical protein